jgi:hypothetical protein
MSHKPAGGLHSRVVKHTRAPKSEPRAHARNPARVAQYGNAVGSHATEFGGRDTSYRGEPDFTRAGYSPPVGPTDNVAAVGCGGGRKVYASGSQGTQGSVNAGQPRPNTQRNPLEQE